jgi:hypothetical protein
MFSNLPVAPIQDEKLKKTLFDMNVFQQSCEEKPIGKVVHIQVAQSL